VVIWIDNLILKGKSPPFGPRVKQSEVRSLSEAMIDLTVADGPIVTWLTDESILVDFNTIKMVSVWGLLQEMERGT
jgi:hypothetical protein